jgi:hypothetical protein
MNKGILEHYGAKIGVHGIAVYAVLAKCANENGQATPSLRYIAQILGIGTGTVQRYLDKLVEYKLVEKQRRVSEHGDYTSTEYILLNVKPVGSGGVSTADTPTSTADTPVSTADTPVSTADTPVSPGDQRVCPQQTHGVSTVDTEQDLLNKKDLNKRGRGKKPTQQPSYETIAAGVIGGVGRYKVPNDFVVPPERLLQATRDAPHLDLDHTTKKFQVITFRSKPLDWGDRWYQFVLEEEEKARERGIQQRNGTGTTMDWAAFHERNKDYGTAQGGHA